MLDESDANDVAKAVIEHPHAPSSELTAAHAAVLALRWQIAQWEPIVFWVEKCLPRLCCANGKAELHFGSHHGSSIGHPNIVIERECVIVPVRESFAGKILFNPLHLSLTEVDDFVTLGFPGFSVESSLDNGSAKLELYYYNALHFSSVSTIEQPQWHSPDPLLPSLVRSPFSKLWTFPPNFKGHIDDILKQAFHTWLPH